MTNRAILRNARKLDALLTATGWTQQRFAHWIKIHRNSLVNTLRGLRQPSLATRKAIEWGTERMGATIPAAAWGPHVPRGRPKTPVKARSRK